MAKILFEEVSPLGNVQAVVEADERVCFFYLYGAQDCGFGVRSVWVRNLRRAPAELETSRMRSGEAPMNPQAFCRDPAAGPRLRSKDLRVCWLPEGNGAALYEGGEPIAIIPPWSGEGGFHGYARDCVGEGPLAWALPTEPTLLRRFEAAAAFWRSWEDDPWPQIQDSLIEGVERVLGRHSGYYAIDGGEWPPRALLRIPTASGSALVTVGVSILPQPNIETDDASELRRIELGVLLPPDWDDTTVKGFGSYLSGQARLPWSQLTWLGPGHTIPCDGWRSPRFSAALLVREHPALALRSLPAQFSDPVSVLWLLPISDEERELAVAHGSAALTASLPPARWREA
jgi:hypothetical protein